MRGLDIRKYARRGSLGEREQDELPRLEDLPFDIKDHILSLVEEPRDLLSFGLASKEWASMIIPVHTEYRELRVYSSRPDVWKHLAARADLAKNIRTIRLMTAKDLSREIYPWTMAGTQSSESSTGIHPLPEMLQAIKNFKSLRSFTWIGSGGHSEVTQDIFEVLAHCRMLDELCLGQIFPRQDHLNPKASIWKLRNLTKLIARGTMWASIQGVEDSFIAMLNESPNLEELTISYNPTQPQFTSCALRSLRKLHLWPEYSISAPGGNLLSCDTLILDFLLSHSTIEDLRWYPVDQGLAAPLGILPSLKRILTNHHLATALLRDKKLFRERKMMFISQVSLGPNTIQLFGQIDGSRLEEIHLWRFEGLDAIKRLAVLFPSIRTLSIPNFGRPFGDEVYTLDECIDCLSRFPCLEAVFDCALWLAIEQFKNEERLNAVTKLLTHCPRLKRLNHWKSSLNRDIDIVFCKSGSQVSWQEVPNNEDWV
ncbi:hypothetical protein GALMADRAFT_224572 [Galerina marginata CBS 339.88]|uniref:F-box domain-containing protein n=1 Tax=Galerina marginata (strain CBS 339.88) TaxID=685588 RepID=A0A067TGU2_GALM3|nr:hypothetical protein GALMADRAFT_224572 [Galerina marginata CBS 339.88]